KKVMTRPSFSTSTHYRKAMEAPCDSKREHCCRSQHPKLVLKPVVHSSAPSGLPTASAPLCFLSEEHLTRLILVKVKFCGVVLGRLNGVRSHFERQFVDANLR